MSEIWKPIPNWEEYQISNLGRIKSFYIRWKEPKLLKQQKDKDGYWKVALSKNNKSYNFQVHRLLALTFIPNPNNYAYINHKNENKSDNTLDNLEWCDFTYNCVYGTARKRASEKCFKRIKCIETGEEFKSLKEASKILNISNNKLSRIINHKGGFYENRHYKYV